MTTPRKHIAILGSTGSIGRQALEVIGNHPEKYTAEVLTANQNASLLIEQAIRFRPSAVVIANEEFYIQVKDALSPEGIRVLTGFKALSEVVQMEPVNLVLTAMVGFAGLDPTIQAIRAGKSIALSNKETLVVAGEFITLLARQNGVSILPVDSEHSAIFQCLVGEFHNPIEKIILTASGGPFRGKRKEDLLRVTPAMALKHPNWSMGSKISIDSATLMNKGLEVIEARWLFGLHAEKIEVVIHPQSIIHSMVQFEDGSLKAQLGVPDMRIPIQYAFSYPDRIRSAFPRYNFQEFSSFTFDRPDLETFRNLALAYRALEVGGNMPCTLNASNEVAVDAFLKEKVNFLEIAEINEKCLEKIPVIRHPGYDDYIQTDKETRIIAHELIS